MNRSLPAPAAAPRWTWGVTLCAALCTLALFLAVPLLETLRNLNVGGFATVRELPPISEPPPPPPPPLVLPEAPPQPATPQTPAPPQLNLPPPPPILPSAPAMQMPSVFVPEVWARESLQLTPTAPAPPAFFELGEIDQPPVPRSQLRPLYPPRARVHRIEGWVDLEFTVTAEGNVTEIAVIAAYPDDIFTRNAIQAASRWSFQPGRMRNQAVPVRVRQRITFELQ